MRTKIPVVVGVFLICGLLTAGLWPFHHPRNAVTWLGDGNGLAIGTHGMVLSAGTFKMTSPQNEASCSLEVWVQPSRTKASSTIVAFYAPENPLQSSLRQSITDLAVQRGSHNNRQKAGVDVVYVDDVFRQHKPVFITITAGEKHTAIYIDGVLRRASSRFRPACEDFAGQLVAGTSPVADDSWAGTLRGLALYDRELTAAQALRHYQNWTKQGEPECADDERCVALYLFDERAGNIAHNKVSSGIDLYIPRQYLILHQRLLQSLWSEFRPEWSYWKDVAINIAGFVPLGFYFCAYFSVCRVKQAAFLTIALGGVVSLTIEVLQAYLPTRDSGVTDLITNTLGTSLGVGLCRWRAFTALLEKHLSRVFSVHL